MHSLYEPTNKSLARALSMMESMTLGDTASTVAERHNVSVRKVRESVRELIQDIVSVRFMGRVPNYASTTIPGLRKSKRFWLAEIGLYRQDVIAGEPKASRRAIEMTMARAPILASESKQTNDSDITPMSEREKALSALMSAGDFDGWRELKLSGSEN